MRKFILIAALLILVVFAGKELLAKPFWSASLKDVKAGMKAVDFYKLYPKKMARTYRTTADESWITFAEPLTGRAEDLVTFHIKEGRVVEWRLNDRQEIIEEYLGEFCSRGIVNGGGKVYASIKDVLARIPQEAFMDVTDRARPVLFTEYYDSGTARFANTAEIIAGEDDAPAFQKGLTIMKLSTELESSPTAMAIEGIVAHELAHRVLDHARKDGGCESEREANRLIKRWGFEKEYEAASQNFGSAKVGGSASCQEK